MTGTQRADAPEATKHPTAGNQKQQVRASGRPETNGRMKGEAAAESAFVGGHATQKWAHPLTKTV